MNEIPHLLTNRNTGFGPYMSQDSYVPLSGDSAVWRAAEDMRQALKLDLPSDWYWKPLHASILHDKELCSWFDTSTTLPPSHNIIPAATFTNARVIGTSNRPKLTWATAVLPQAFDTTLVLTSSGSGVYTRGTESGTIKCTLTDTTITPDLSKLMPGADFALLTPAPPSIGMSVGWNIEPSRYPVSYVTEVLSNRSSCNLLMAAYNMQALYSAVPCDIMRLGIIAAVIARATKDHGQ